MDVMLDSESRLSNPCSCRRNRESDSLSVVEVARLDGGTYFSAPEISAGIGAM